MDNDNNVVIGLVLGVIMGMVAVYALWSYADSMQDKDIKVKYIKCGIANYNTTSGAFEFKQQYKILGE
jgi:hypothetical protein